MQVFSVGQVVRYLKDVLEYDAILADLWIGGEVSNFSRARSGHCYFVVKDAVSQINCVLFRGPGGYDRDLGNGQAVLVHGKVSVYETRGELQMVVDVVQPEGVGALALEFERLKTKLEAEGLFELGRKRRLPLFPQRIGVVTSPTGAVWHDIQQVITRRYPLVELVLAPTAVQGEQAAPGVEDALRRLNLRDDIDLIIVARGGGSLEDLWAFNEERVARAIFASRIPVISGVGHETDTTIADWVADRRGPTPSVAAEIAVPDRQELRSHVLLDQRRLKGALADTMGRARTSLDSLRMRLGALAPPIDRERQRVDDQTRLLTLHLQRLLDARRNAIALRVSQLDAFNPQHTLARGYALVQRGDTGTVVTRPDQAAPGAALMITVADGAFPALSGPPIAGGAPVPPQQNAEPPRPAAPKAPRKRKEPPQEQMQLL
ncbi:MAG: exodeoxyribonuclease VII large subunit [Chloroflexi bacterium]|nr:exodeoxyribonuclease VII large subunit [Chloroflexota bacterium]